ncbi:Aspartic proteinase CDR1 [Linum perenne]
MDSSVVAMSSSLSLVFFFSILIFSTSYGANITVPLIHRDSVYSPLYNASETISDSAQRVVEASRGRHDYLSSLFSNDVRPQAKLTVGPNNFAFYLEISLGDPPLPQLVLMDTGSSFLWVKCKPCNEECKHSRGDPKIYDPSKSKTSYELPCLVGCDECTEYAGGRVSEGIYATEQLTLQTSNNHRSIITLPNILFGCSRYTTIRNTDLDKHFSGIIGLGPDTDPAVELGYPPLGGAKLLVSRIGLFIQVYDDAFCFALQRTAYGGMAYVSIIGMLAQQVPLIYRDSVYSPLYNASETIADRSQRVVEASRGRHDHLSSLLFSDDVRTQSRLTPGTNSLAYYLNVSIGDPPLPQLVLMDTGSAFLWVKCQPCDEECSHGPGDPKIYDPTKSRTSYELPCEIGCDTCIGWFFSKRCKYTIKYVDGRLTEGIYATEQLTFQTSNYYYFTVILRNILFGCSRHTTFRNRDQDNHFSGIIGLGPDTDPSAVHLGYPPLVSDMGSKFSYCTGRLSDRSYPHNQMSFGGKTHLMGLSTPINIATGNYYVRLVNISLGRKVQIDLGNLSPVANSETERISIIGMTAQQNHNIGFDIKRKRILTIKTPLIHRDSYHSPLYDATKTTADLAEESLRSSIARHAHTPSLSDNGSGGVDAELVNSIKNNIFYANFSIGYPPVPQLAVMDTGSTFLWLKCLPCSPCSPSSGGTFFDPTKSKTYVPRPCWFTKYCKYTITYMGGQKSEGVEATEELRFQVVGGPAVVVPKFPFGCSSSVTGTEGQDQHFNGVLPLGMSEDHENSLVARQARDFPPIGIQFVEEGELVLDNFGMFKQVEDDKFCFAFLRSPTEAPSLSDNGRGGVDAELVNSIKNNIFYVNFSIGYPHVPQLGVMDTGSDFLWVKCLPCSPCSPSSGGTFFDPTKSKTYVPRPCWFTKYCKYTVAYVGGQRSEGVEATEQLRFQVVGGRAVVVPKFQFGCCSSITGTEGQDQHFNGILPLGMSEDHENSLVARFGYKFSYCVGSIVDREARDFPPIGIQFVEEGELVLDNFGMFKQVEDDKFCFAFLRSPTEVSFIGMMAQQGYNIGYDLVAKRLYIKDVDCQTV